MAEPSMGPISEYIPIPKAFYSFGSGARFSKCIQCDRYLLEDGTQYLIEKAVKFHPETDSLDVIFEYAMCLGCAEASRKAMSKESLEKLEEYFRERVDLMQRRQDMLEKFGMEIEPWISTCVVSGQSVKEMGHYQILAHCDGPDLVFSVMPYALGEDAAMEMSKLLSQKTLGEMDDFIDEHFGLPPELKDLWKDRPILLI